MDRIPDNKDEKMIGDETTAGLKRSIDKIEIAYRIITEYIMLKSSSQDINLKFYEWLAEKTNQREKQQALKKVFDEMLSE